MEMSQRTASVPSSAVDGIQIKPVTATLGAKVICGDVRQLDNRKTHAIKQAWLDNLFYSVSARMPMEDDFEEPSPSAPTSEEPPSAPTEPVEEVEETRDVPPSSDRQKP